MRQAVVSRRRRNNRKARVRGGLTLVVFVLMVVALSALVAIVWGE